MSKTPFSRLLLLFGIIFGALVRLYPVWTAGFPVNDGGMFYRILQDLIASDFQLPLYTTYNQLDIPFAYPPLPFYFAGFISQAFQIPLIEIVRWFPALISVLTIPAYFQLARILSSDDDKAAVATLFFALMPRSFEWLIMGGGLTRAPGTFFFILFAGYLIRVFRDLDQASAKFAVLSGGAVLLCHPERTLHALTMAMLFATLFVRTKRGVTNALIIAFGVAIVSIPWWGVNLARFGIDPFLLANRAGGDRSLFWSPLLLLNFTDETIAITALLGVIGILYEISKGRWILPLWAVLPFITDPRSAPHIAPIQFSLLAGIALVDVILPSLTTVKERSLENRMGKIVIAYFLTIGLVNGLLGAFTLSALRLSVEERDALTWISQNIPSTGNRFLIYPRKSDAALSPLLEWFPALTSQTSLSTYQGREWLDGSLHSDAFFANREQWLACAAQKVQCIEDWSASSGEKVDYILFSSNTQKATHLSVSLLNSSEYILIYQDHGIKIFERNP